MKYLILFEAYKKKDPMKEFNEFIMSNDKNKWIKFGKMNIYVRQSKHIINDEVINFIDLSNFTFDRERDTNKGTFTKFLSECNNLNLNLFIENVLNSYILATIERFGYIKYNSYGEDIGHGSYYKIGSQD